MKGEKEIKKELIAHYIKLRKLSPKKAITRLPFSKSSPHSRYQVEQLFGGYVKFQDVAEKTYLNSLSKSQRALISERNKKFDPEATQDDCIDDLRKLQESNPLASLSRTDYRNNGSYSDATWNQYFGTFLEFRRQAGLELSRNQHKLERQIAKHASLDDYKRFYREQVFPYYRKYIKKNRPNKIKNIMVISDIHDIECCEFTLSVFIAECERKQPDVIAFNGDIFDLPEFSKYNVDPRHYKILERFEFVWNRIFAPIRKVCPNAQMDLIVGNHEFRLLKLLADQTPNIKILLSDVMNMRFKDVFRIDEYQMNFISKFDLSATSKKDIEDQLKKNYEIYYGCFLLAHHPDPKLMIMDGSNGHHHNAKLMSGAYINAESQQAKRFTWTQTPACHIPDAEYLQNLSQWGTGFLDVVINIDTKQVIQNIRHTFRDWTEIDGILYERTN